MSDLDRITRLVVEAVRGRLQTDEPEVIELVVREVVSAMAGPAGVPRPSTPEASRAPASGAQDNGDGTITTALGAVLPTPNGAATPLELCTACVEQERRQRQNRAVVTTTGRNCTGVVARVSSAIAEARGDIQDISQTIVADFFTMIMVVDLSGLQIPFSEFKARLLAAAEELNIHAVVLHEEVMRSLQRV